MSKAIIEVELPEGIHVDKNGKISFWDFVAATYPGYSSSDDIAENGDLEKIVNGDWEEGDCAWQIIQDEYDGNEDDAYHGAVQELAASKLDIYERAIQGFIDNICKIEVDHETS